MNAVPGEARGAGRAGVHGVILAAGLSRRFGADKLLHRLSGKPVFSWALEAACASFLDGIVLVCRKELTPHLPSNPRVRTIVNPSPEIGQSSSIRLGLSALPDQATHALILLADQPLVTPALIDDYVDLANHGSSLACSGGNDYLGPPALFGREWFDSLKGLQGDTGARKILSKERNALQIVKPRFQGQGMDIDIKENLQAVEQLMQNHRDHIFPRKSVDRILR